MSEFRMHMVTTSQRMPEDLLEGKPFRRARLSDVYQSVVPIIDDPTPPLSQTIGLLQTIGDLLELPPKRDEGADPSGVDGSGAADLDARICAREVRETWRSIRAGRQPHSIVHALVLKDYMTLPRLSAVLRQDTDDVERRLGALEREGIVMSTLDSNGQPVYFLPGLPE